MSLAGKYLETVLDQLRRIGETQAEAVETAASRFAEALVADRWIWLFGTGHSCLLAQELFYRAGGLVRVRPILHPPLMLHVSASRSTLIERDAGVVDKLLAAYPIGAEDVLLVASNSGRNAVPVELASRARECGASVVALVNRRHCDEFASRHDSGRKLPDLADIVLDNCGVIGDACVAIGGERVGAASTVTGAALLQMLACRAVELALEQGWTSEIFSSANATGAAGNDELIARVEGLVKHI